MAGKRYKEPERKAKRKIKNINEKEIKNNETKKEDIIIVKKANQSFEEKLELYEKEKKSNNKKYKPNKIPYNTKNLKDKDIDLKNVNLNDNANYDKEKNIDKACKDDNANTKVKKSNLKNDFDDNEIPHKRENKYKIKYVYYSDHKFLKILGMILLIVLAVIITIFVMKYLEK